MLTKIYSLTKHLVKTGARKPYVTWGRTVTGLTHSDISKVSIADVKLWNYVTKCPIAPSIQLQQVAHSQRGRRTGIPRQPQPSPAQPSRVGGTNQHRPCSLSIVTVQVCSVSQCTSWRHTTCCSSHWPCSRLQHGRLPDRTGRSVSMPRAVRDRVVGPGPATSYVQSGPAATQPPTE